MNGLTATWGIHMNSRYVIPVLLGLLLLTGDAGAQGRRPTHHWSLTTPPEVGLDARALSAFDADIAEGKYGYIDSMLVIRHGKIAYERYYGHDYEEIYHKEASTPGPLVVGSLTGPYNYFNPWWHPYYQDSMLHTMQSVTKSVTSLVIGIALGRNEFPDLDTPVLKFFAPGSVSNIDDRKRRMTIRHLLTMTTGLDWNEDLPYTDPDNTWSALQETNDWVQFTIDRPMSGEPGETFQYNSGATLILGQVFYRATGIDLEEYAVRHLFRPLGIDDYFWKRTPRGLVDTQEGLYISTRDIARIAHLVLHRGQWDNEQIIPEDWIRDSVAPSVSVNADRSWEYGYKWWLIHYQHDGEDRIAIAGLGFGDQVPIVFPELDMVAVFTGWNTLPGRPELDVDEAIGRLVASLNAP